MKRCSFFCAGWWPFVVLPLLLLLPLLFFCWHSIEERVADNTRADLQAAGLEWVEVDTFNQGRGVLLSGTAPNKAAVDKALSIANSAKGVRIAEFRDGNISITPPLPPTFSAISQNGVVTLTGVFGSQDAVDDLVTKANKVYGQSNVVNKLLITENTAELPSIGNLFSALDAQGLTDNFTASIKQNELKLNGTVSSDKTKASIGRKAAEQFSGTVVNQLNVVIPEPVIVEPTIEPTPAPEEVAPVPIERDICEELVGDLLSVDKINFQTNKATIDEQSFNLLERIAATAKRCVDARFEVAGHTDSRGRLELNMKLSQARAQSVVDYLINLGLNAERFNAKGYGPNKPIADNADPEGRAANRRIEFKLQN